MVKVGEGHCEKNNFEKLIFTFNKMQDSIGSSGFLTVLFNKHFAKQVS